MSIKNKDIIVHPETPVGIQFGLIYEIPFSTKLTMQSSFIFTSKGTDYKIDHVDHSIAPAYFEIPVHSVYYFGRRSFKISVFAGPYFSSAFGGYKIDSTGFKSLTFGRTNNKDLKILDVGFDWAQVSIIKIM